MIVERWLEEEAAGIAGVQACQLELDFGDQLAFEAVAVVAAVYHTGSAVAFLAPGVDPAAAEAVAADFRSQSKVSDPEVRHQVSAAGLVPVAVDRDHNPGSHQLQAGQPLLEA